MSEDVDITEVIHGLARGARWARKKRYSWTGSDEHLYYLDGRHTALKTQADLLAFEYANSDECDWSPRAAPESDSDD